MTATAIPETDSRTVVQTESAPAPYQGAPYSQAIRVGELVFVSGQVSLDPETHEVVGASIEEQTEQVLSNLEAILKAPARAWTDSSRPRST